MRLGVLEVAVAPGRRTAPELLGAVAAKISPKEPDKPKWDGVQSGCGRSFATASSMDTGDCVFS